MPTRRTPKKRTPRRWISPEVVEIFRQMTRLDRSSDQWWQLHSRLLEHVKVPPWQFPAVERPEEMFPDGSVASRTWSNFDARRLYRELEKAAAENSRA